MNGSLSFKELRAGNTERCNRWRREGIVLHPIDLMRRIADLVNLLFVDDIGEKIADIVLDLDLLAEHFGISIEDVVVAKFNRTAERYGFPERLGR